MTCAVEIASVSNLRVNWLILIYKTFLEQALNTYQQTGVGGICGVLGTGVTRSNTSSALEELDTGKKKEDRKEELALK